MLLKIELQKHGYAEFHMTLSVINECDTSKVDGFAITNKAGQWSLDSEKEGTEELPVPIELLVPAIMICV